MNTIYVNADNLKKIKNLFRFKVAVIARPDWFLKKNETSHLIVETRFGIHNRCFAANFNGINFLIIYGRFDKIRSTSADINFEINQEVISLFGIEKIIGTFVTGSIKDDNKASSIYVLSDFVGIGGFNCSRNKQTGFRNVDMFNPFCKNMRDVLIDSSRDVDFLVHHQGIYVCFHGFPRIETSAELDFYKSNGWDVVGQTLDPEATLAREAGCHYAALAATIDDRELRRKFLENDKNARKMIDKNILVGRRKTFEIFLNSLSCFVKKNFKDCNCLHQGSHVKKRSKFFYYLPDFIN